VSGLPKIDLMQSTEVGQPFQRDGWIYEEKYDGWRMVDYWTVRISSSSAGRPRTTRARSSRPGA